MSSAIETTEDTTPHVSDEDVATVEADPAADGEAAPDDDAPPSQTVTPAQVDALAKGMAAQAHQAAASEASYRDDEIFTSNATAALEQIRVLNMEVRIRESEWLGLKEDAADAKKQHDKVAKRLSDLIVELTGGTTDTTQPKLTVVRETHQVVAGEKARCAYERETGRPCSVCRSRAVDAAPPLPDAPAHPDHPEHAESARAQDIQALRTALLARRCILDVADLMALEESDLAELRAWADTPDAPVPPAVLTSAHVADAPGSEFQSCSLCWMVLRHVSNLAETQGDGASDEAGWIPDGAFYSLACEGPVLEGEVEAARPVKKRGAAKGRKKHDPEAERVHQAQAGKARKATTGTTPKPKATRKAGKAKAK